MDEPLKSRNQSVMTAPGPTGGRAGQRPKEGDTDMTATRLPLSEIRNVLRGLDVPVFMAGIDNESDPQLTLHVSAPHRAADAAKLAQAEIAKLGCELPVKARQWDSGRFARHGSLETTVRALAHDTIVFDPTAAVWRSQTMVELSSHLRREMGEPLLGIYLEPRSRTVYLLLKGASFDRDGSPNEALLQSLTRGARDVMIAWRQQRRSSIDLTARLCFELPAYPLVAIDDASPAPLAGNGTFRKARLMAASAAVLALTAIGLGTGSARADGPAVSGPNLKLDVGGGFYREDGAGLATGVFTFPIGENFGGQIEGAIGTLDDDFAWGGGGMAYWRDPDVALAGLFVSHGAIGDDNTTRYGGIGKFYLGQFDISGQAGYQTHDQGSDGAFGNLEIGFYPVDDLRIALGGDLNRVANFAFAGIEFRPGFEALPGMTLFLDGQIGEHDHSGVLAGVRFYFGESTTLIDRHRRDDDASTIPFLKEEKEEKEKKYMGENNEEEPVE